MICGCYSLDLYCEVNGCRAGWRPRAQFTGETAGECRAKARRAGWRIVRFVHAFCPAHARKENRP